MKKQILILTFFVAALLAGTNAFGQYLTVPDALPSNLTPLPLAGCTGVDALHPVQGIEYNYIVETTDASDDVRWFVINNYDLKDGTIGGQVDSIINSQNQILPVGDNYIDPADGDGDYILSLGTNNQYDVAFSPGNGTGTSNTTGVEHQIDITWKFFDGYQDNEVLLVAVVNGDDDCTDNIAVYRIIPTPSFTLDVAVLDQAGDSIAGPLDPLTGECVSPIEFATYQSIDDVTPNGTLTVDYGENWVYFIVTAANFIDSWRPRFQISYAGARDSMMAEWTYLAAATNTASAAWHSINIAAGTSPDDVIAGGATTGGGTAAGAAINGAGDMTVADADGESIVVRVRIDYGTGVEHDNAASLLSFAIDGTMYDPSDGSYTIDNGFDDLAHTDCSDDGFSNDVVTYEITPRPEVEEGTVRPETKTGDETN